MPSDKILEKKKQAVAALAEQLKGSCAGVLVDYKGINVADDTALRNELREANVQYNVVKNSLLHRAVQEADLADMQSVLTGSTALATSKDDHVAAARILQKFADKHPNYTIKSGFMDGQVLTLDAVEALAKLPTRDVMLATVCYAFNAPIAAFARVVQAIVDKDADAPAEVPAEA